MPKNFKKWYLIAFLVAIALGFFTLPVYAKSTPKPPDTKGQKEIRTLIENAMNDVIQGDSFRKYWCPSEYDDFGFLSPTQYKILRIIEDKDNSSKAGLAIVRINSSNRGGMPIVIDWNFLIGGNNGKYCISKILK